ncbi:MAG: hypothetical protein N4A35_10245 [Flavobacteriales bacterium]|jgi:hypothetical protein|nr:hypothetical protein [Flavobacteriales bacterium]
MNNNNEYRNLKKLVNSLANNLEALENGNLSVADLYSLLDDARNIHERIAILHYLAIERSVKKEEDRGLKFDFSTTEEPDGIHPNQTNLIDAIKVENHIEAVRKSIGEQQPLFEIEQEIKEEPAFTPESPIQEEKVEQEEEKKDHSISINDKFSSNAEQPTLADRLSQQPIKDLTKAIGLNQKFLFMNDLFEGENEKYKEAIETINNFSAFIEADEYINNNLKYNYNWDINGVSAQKFMDLVKRRFL